MPLSGDPEARARQLANLRDAPPAPAGNRRAMVHGGYAALSADELEPKVREVRDALAADAPLRDPDGSLPAADATVVRLFASCLVRLERVEHDLADHGWRDRETGEPRSAVELEGKLRREALDLAESLGMTPRSRVRLGLDLQRGQTFAEQLADDHRAEEAEE